MSKVNAILMKFSRHVIIIMLTVSLADIPSYTKYEYIEFIHMYICMYNISHLS